MDTRESLLNSYNQAAAEYADAFCEELRKKPFDLEALRKFAKMVPAQSPVCDLGCGPGHIAKHLQGCGLKMMGIDLSDNMIALAKKRNPSIDFKTGDMLDLDLPDASLGGIVAFYSIIHINPNLLPKVFREMHRTLVPGGVLFISCHQGSGEVEVENWFDKGVKYHCYLHQQEELTELLEMNGFEIISAATRDPFDFEYETRRIYITAQKT